MNLQTKIKKTGLVKTVLDAGGSIHPLIIPAEFTNGTGLMNPSIYLDGDKLLINIRHVNYTLYHSEHKRFQHIYGPLQYLHPENDLTLRTWNYLCELDDNLNLHNIRKVDTSEFDVTPLWEFIGLEDARVVRWDGKLYLTGVRRDTTTHGEGRMELSEIEISDNTVREVRRVRIPAPGKNDTYCEKNWMPILDKPFHYVKWSNPTEVIKFDLDTLQTETVYLDQTKIISGVPDFRGSSHIIPYGDYYLALTHEVSLFKPVVGNKDATYRHRFIVWDKNWNIVKFTNSFSFMNADIEFCCGATFYKNDLLVSFGFQDNCAFVLKIPQDILKEILELPPPITSTIKTNIIETNTAWKKYPSPTLEITTVIPEKGCVVDCVFCPQRTLEKVYQGTRILTLDNFKKLIDKIPKEVRITFAGFVEPWMNKYCTQMVLYAHEQGHPVSVFTTGIGVSIKDLEAIAHIPYDGGPNGGFTLHLPDSELLARHPITPSYIKTLEWLKEHGHRIKNFTTMTMGDAIHPDVAHIFNSAPSYQMWSRSGNLIKESLLKPRLVNLKDRWKTVFHEDNNRTCGCVEHLYHNVMLPNGDVSLCCMDYGLEKILGNLYTQEYEEIIPIENTCFSLCNFCENGVNPKSL